jgi:hypothetical protein
MVIDGLIHLMPRTGAKLAATDPEDFDWKEDGYGMDGKGPGK